MDKQKENDIIPLWMTAFLMRLGFKDMKLMNNPKQCDHEIDYYRTRQLPVNKGFIGYGTQHYICRKCNCEYIL